MDLDATHIDAGPHIGHVAASGLEGADERRLATGLGEDAAVLAFLGAPAGILVASPALVVKALNPKGAAILGVDRRVAVGRGLESLSPSLALSFAPLAAQALAGQPVPFANVGLGRHRLAEHEGERRIDGRVSALTAARQPSVVFILWESEAQSQAARCERHLVETADALGSSLCVRELALRLARHLVPGFGDWCLVQERNARRVEPLALCHVDPSIDAATDALLRRVISVPGGDLPRRAEPREGELCADVSAEWLHLQLGLLREDAETLGCRSAIRVALRGGGETLGFVTLVFSSSARQHTRADVTHVQEVLDRAAPRLMQARTYTRAQDGLVARDHMISIAAHELRTPLTALHLQLSNVRRLLEQEPCSHLTAKIDSSRRRIERMTQLIDGLLDASCISSGRLTLSPAAVDLVATAEEVIESLRDPAEMAGCELHLVEAGPVIGQWDRLRLVQVLTNLLSNSIKYGAGRPIEVTVQEVSSRARVSVRDHGIGITPEHMERIFGLFERAVSEHAYGGLGLGLYITREIIQAHGGRIWAASEPGAGATFTFELPLRR